MPYPGWQSYPFLGPFLYPQSEFLLPQIRRDCSSSFCPNPSHSLAREWHCLHPKRALSFYIQRTSPSRKTEVLFVSFHSKQGFKVSPSCISKWVREAIRRLINLWVGNIPMESLLIPVQSLPQPLWLSHLEQVCKTAIWNTPHTFIKHYKIDCCQEFFLWATGTPECDIPQVRQIPPLRDTAGALPKKATRLTSSQRDPPENRDVCTHCELPFLSGLVDEVSTPPALPRSWDLVWDALGEVQLSATPAG